MEIKIFVAHLIANLVDISWLLMAFVFGISGIEMHKHRGRKSNEFDDDYISITLMFMGGVSYLMFLIS